MFWFLIICVVNHQTIGASTTCLPMQRMADKSQCEFVGSQYRSMTDVNTKCVALAKDPNRK